jgi:hypothetical protein
MHQLIVRAQRQEVASRRDLLVRQLIWSDEIVLIGITHHLLPVALIQAFKERRTFWRKIQVVYPNCDNMHRLIKERQVPDRRLSEWEASKRNVQIIFSRQHSQHSSRWECLECMQDLYFVGSRYKRNEQAYVRFAPLLLESDPRDITQLTIGSNIALFDQFSHAIDAMLICSNLLDEWAILTKEWILLGKYDKGIFYYLGITNRVNVKATATHEGMAFPVVLVVLYTETLEGTYAVLQERMIYNTPDHIGTYSNISSRLCTDDVVGLYPGRFQAEPTTNDIVATNTFNQFSGLSRRIVLENVVWRNGARRTLREQFGLDVHPDRLEKQPSHYLKREDGDLFFQIFSLKLRRDLEIDEWEMIQQQCPYAALKQFSMSELQQLYSENKFNHLLQDQFIDLFVPMYQQVDIIP